MWLKELRREADDSLLIILIGNKCDMKNRVIDYQLAADFAQDNDMAYLETSAKTGTNVK